ncbi:hypothetical protein [Neobacillus sp. Marseille-QA0830]
MELNAMLLLFYALFYGIWWLIRASLALVIGYVLPSLFLSTLLRVWKFKHEGKKLLFIGIVIVTTVLNTFVVMEYLYNLTNTPSLFSFKDYSASTYLVIGSYVLILGVISTPFYIKDEVKFRKRT